MLKTTLTVLVTATVCFGIVATTGFSAQEGRVINMKVGDLIKLQTANVGCRVLNKTTVACGENKIPNAIAVYFTPTGLNIVKFNAAGTKYSVIYAMKR